MRIRRILKTFLVFLASLLGVVLLAFIVINLPFSHRFVTRKINGILITSHLPINIRSVNRVYPWSVYVQGVLIHEPDGDTIIYAGKVRSGLKPLALMKKRLILRSVVLGDATINILRNVGEDQLNIAAAFSSGNEAGPEDQKVEKSPFDVSFADAEIDNLKFRLIDSVGGIYLSEDIGMIKIVTRKMSLNEKTIILRSLALNGSVGSLTLNNKTEEENSGSGSPWNFGLEKLQAANINFVYDDTVSRLRLDLLAGEIVTDAKVADLNKRIIDFDRISVSGTSAVVRMDSKKAGESDVKGEKADSSYWDIHGGRITLKDVAFQMVPYSDTAGYSSLSGFSIIGLGADISGLVLNKADAGAEVDGLKFDLGNGFSLRNMSGKLDSRPGSTSVDLEIETARSKIDLKGSAAANIFDILGNPAGMKKADLAIRNSSVSLEDAVFFRQDLKKIAGYDFLSGSPLLINADMELDGSAVTIPAFSIGIENGFKVTLSGVLSNIFNPRSASTDLNIRLSELDGNWVKALMKDIQPGFPVPDYKALTLDVSVNDSLLSPHFTAGLRSDLGNIDVQGSFDDLHDRFSISSDIRELLLNKILNTNALGLFSGSLEINGAGLKNKSLRGTAALKIDSLGAMDYVYTSALVNAEIEPGKYDIHLMIDDPGLKMDFLAGLNTGGSALSLKAGGKIFANLGRIHLLKDTVIVEGIVSADFKKLAERIEANLNIPALKIASPNDSVTVTKISAQLKSDSLMTDLSAGSDFFSSSFHVRRPAGKLGQFIKDYSSYFASMMDIRKPARVKQELDIPVLRGNIGMSYSEALRIFIPDTSLYFSHVSMLMSSDTAQNKINLNIKGKDVKYKLLQIGSLNATVSDSSASLDLDLYADTCMIGPQAINRLHIMSHFHDWESLTSLSVTDRNGRQFYNFGIQTDMDSNGINISIPSGELIMNTVRWQTDKPDILKIDFKKRIFIPSLSIHTEVSSISLLNEWEGGWQKYRLLLKDVGLSSFFRSDLLPGKPDFSISGSVEYSQNKVQGDRLTSDLQLSNVIWSDLSYRNITLNSAFLSDTTGNFDFDIKTRLDTSGIDLKGKKILKGSTSFSARFSLIPVNTIQPFVKKYLSDLKGNISGDFDINVENGNNSLSGDIRLSDVNLRINALSSTFRMPEDNIKFSGKRMLFDNFRILDSLSHELFVDGYVEFGRNRQILSNIDITSTNLQVMNRKDVNNATFYGDIFIDSKLSVRGPVTSPVLKGKITLGKGTDIYFRQTEDLNLSESGRVLTFESRKGARQPVRKPERGVSLYNKSSIESVVAIDPATKINIDISKKMFSIDMVIQGGGELNYNMLVNSQVNMSGKYEISEGAANLKMVGWPNKAFRLTKGGFIRWDGKLDDPELNLEAVNRVKSSYINPVDNKERYVDFDVTLKIANRLSKMDVIFTINTPDQYLMSMINTMSPEEQMRQAITILLFEYIDLPGISTSSNYVAEQVNQMVSSQLNSLTKTSIKGVDISFGIDSYTQGTAGGAQQTKTSLSYEVKKNLLNNRAKVEFSGIVSDANQTQTNNTSLNNFTFEYRIDSAATKFLKVYNEHTYEDVFEGDVVKTGVGFSYRKSYPSLSDIWRKDKKVRQPDKKEK